MSVATTPIRWKNEQEFVKAIQACIGSIHDVLDTIFAGIVELGRSNASILIADDPVVALLPSTNKLLNILDTASNTFRIDSIVVFSPFLRILRVQNSSPLRDIRASHIKPLLPKLHAFTWNQLAIFCKRIECAKIDELLGLFLNKYHLSLFETDIFPAILSFLTSSWRSENICHSRRLVQLSVDYLKVVVDGQTANTKTKNIKPGLQRKNVIIGESANMKDHGVECRRECLKWIASVFLNASFNQSIPLSAKVILFDTLMSTMNTDRQLVLRGMAAIVLYNQPSTLFPSLPIFLHIIKAALHHDQTRNYAHEISQRIDLLVRPRRPYLPRIIKEDLPIVEPVLDSTVSQAAPSVVSPGPEDKSGLVHDTMKSGTRLVHTTPITAQAVHIERNSNSLIPNTSFDHPMANKRSIEMALSNDIDELPLPQIIDESSDE